VTVRRGLDWMFGFIDHLYTSLRARRNYSALADVHFTVHRYTHARVLESSLVVSWQWISKEPITGKCPELNESSPDNPMIHFNITLQSTSVYLSLVFILFDKILYTFLFCAIFIL
jgi:hypothetical protein